jgi:signal transduction histidine kinase
MRGKTSVDPSWRSIHEDGSPFPGEEHPAMVTLRTGEPQSEVIMGVHKPDDSLTWISINSEPLFEDDDSEDDNSNSRLPYAVITSFHDITQQKEAEDRALELAIEREQARILAEFIESVSHEFHTPLSIIETSVYLLERTLAPAHHARLDVIRTQSRSISRLVQMMLTLTRLDSSESLLLRPLRPIELLYEINDLYRQKSETDAITWQIAGDPDTPGINGDFRYLVVALKQLVDNALHHTSAGGTITVRLNTATDDNGNQEVILSVRDDGNGIDPVHLPHVFERFYRSDRAHSTPGFGLGLAIVRRIARTHAGYVSIESTPGSGTEVFIHLPQIDD